MSADRFEHKYLLSPRVYRRFIAALTLYARHDRYSRRDRNRRYFVRSLYFDTSDYRAYTEKIVGERNRIKLRIRAYARTRMEAAFVSVELKTRDGARVRKFSAHVPFDHYLAYRATGFWRSDIPELIEFERLVRLGDLRPVVLVDYRREAFVPRDRANVRITIDHDLRAAHSSELYPTAPIFRIPGPRMAVLEIKVADGGPDWLEKLVQDFGLGAVPNSKYAQAIERTQHQLVVRR
jgi:hypothetical protein